MKKIILIIFIIFHFTGNSVAQLNTQNIIYKARLELYKKNYTEALKLFNNVINIKPELIEPYFYRGLTKYRLNDLSGAKQDFKKTLQMNPFYVSAYHYLSVVNMEQKDYNSAIHNINEAIKLAPFDAGLFLTRGVIFLQTNKIDKALAEFKKAKKLNPQLPEAYVNTGISYNLQNKIDSAITCYNKAINLNNFYHQAFARRALSYYDKNKLDSALRDINMAIKLNNDNALYYYWRANIYYKIPDFNASLKDFSKVIELSPNNATAYYNKATIENEIGLYNNAINDYKKVIELSPKNILPRYNKALVHYRLKEYNNALNELNAIVKIFDDFAPAYKLRAEIYSLQNNQKLYYYNLQKYKHLENISSKIDTTYLSKIISFDDNFFDKDTTKNEVLPFDFIKLSVTNKNKVLDFLKKYNYTLLTDFKNVKYGNFSISFDKFYNSTPDSIFASINSNISENNITSIISEIEFQNFNEAKTSISTNKNFDNFTKNFLQAQVFLAQKSSVNNKTANLDSALNYYSLIQNKNCIVLFNIGNIYLIKKEYYTALYYYQKSIEKDKNFSPAYFNSAFCNIYLHNTQKACKQFSKAGEKGITQAYQLIQKYCRE